MEIIRSFSSEGAAISARLVIICTGPPRKINDPLSVRLSSAYFTVTTFQK
jgi:hypothetical protein